jgi:hypothetical protein
MEIRYLKRLRSNGIENLVMTYVNETVLQYKEDGLWYDVERVTE